MIVIAQITTLLKGWKHAILKPGKQNIVNSQAWHKIQINVTEKLQIWLAKSMGFMLMVAIHWPFQKNKDQGYLV